MVNLGKKLKSLRLAENLTQQQVAQRLGVTKTIISSYENDLRQPSYDNLLKLANLFKVSTDWLLGNEKTQKYDFSGLTDEQANLVMGIIKEFEKFIYFFKKTYNQTRCQFPFMNVSKNKQGELNYVL